MKNRLITVRSVVFAGLLLSGVGFAQDPQAAQAPPPLYTGSLGGGLAITGGNTDTKNFNLSANAVRDPRTRNLIKGSASYLRGNNEGVLNLDRFAVNLRDEYTLSGRTFLFGQLDYIRSPFQGVIFLWSPTAGIGHRIIDTDVSQLVVSGGAGGILEKNPGIAARKSGSLTAGQSFQHSLSSSTTFTQSISSLWKTNDFADSLTNFAVGLSTTVAGNLELKLEFIDSYKNKPVPASLDKNDTAFITSFLMNF